MGQFGYFLLVVLEVARLMVEIIAKLVMVGFKAVNGVPGSKKPVKRKENIVRNRTLIQNQRKH